MCNFGVKSGKNNEFLAILRLFDPFRPTVTLVRTLQHIK